MLHVLYLQFLAIYLQSPSHQGLLGQVQVRVQEKRKIEIQSGWLTAARYARLFLYVSLLCAEYSWTCFLLTSMLDRLISWIHSKDSVNVFKLVNTYTYTYPCLYQGFLSSLRGDNLDWWNELVLCVHSGSAGRAGKEEDTNGVLRMGDMTAARDARLFLYISPRVVHSGAYFILTSTPDSLICRINSKESVKMIPTPLQSYGQN